MSDILTLDHALALADVIRWAQSNARLRWLDQNTREIEAGTARSIGDERGNFLAYGDDVRDAYLRITTARGWEWFVPMADVMAFIARGEMVRDEATR